jgi:addiction module HigA family antidote
MHNPPHPGELLRATVLGERGIYLSVFARTLGVSRVALSRVVNGRAAVSADMALRLAAALGGSAESWLQMQAAYDLWQAAKKRPMNKRFRRADLLPHEILLAMARRKTRG